MNAAPRRPDWSPDPATLIPPGTRVRSTVDPTLTGYVKHWEWNAPGVISGIPYCIGWDDSERAHEVLGFLFVYAIEGGVEPIPEAEA